MSIVEYRIDTNRVATISLNRPDRLNAVNPDLIDELVVALRQAESDEARSVILRGNGRAFCAGHDLKAHEADLSVEQVRAQVQQIQEVTRMVRRLPGPVIAAVHGYAMGAGCELALCSDLVVVAESATFGFPEVGVGLSVTGGISHILPHAVGLVRAKELLLLGRRFSADEAKSWGLVNGVVPDGELESRALALATEIASKSQLAVRVAKEVIDNGPGSSMETALLTELLHAQLAMGSTDADAAATAFRTGAR